MLKEPNKKLDVVKIRGSGYSRQPMSNVSPLFITQNINSTHMFDTFISLFRYVYMYVYCRSKTIQHIYKQYIVSVFSVDIVSVFPTRKCQKFRKIYEYSYYRRRKYSYLLNELRNVNEIHLSVKIWLMIIWKVTKNRVSPSLQKTHFWKTTGWGLKKYFL